VVDEDSRRLTCLLPIITFRLLSCVLATEVNKEHFEPDHPLELADIMPLATKTYDKMRPPKYKGKHTNTPKIKCVLSMSYKSQARQPFHD
jgi:hypothetical protein